MNDVINKLIHHLKDLVKMLIYFHIQPYPTRYHDQYNQGFLIIYGLKSGG